MPTRITALPYYIRRYLNIQNVLSEYFPVYANIPARIITTAVPPENHNNLFYSLNFLLGKCKFSVRNLCPYKPLCGPFNIQTNRFLLFHGVIIGRPHRNSRVKVGIAFTGKTFTFSVFVRYNQIRARQIRTNTP